MRTGLRSVPVSEHDPYESPEAKATREAAQQHQREAVATAVSEDAVWLTSGPRGRRIIRRALRDAGIDIMAARIGSSFHANYGQMCFHEGTRARAFGLLVQLLRALATGEMKPESWQLLLMEKDDG